MTTFSRPFSGSGRAPGPRALTLALLLAAIGNGAAVAGPSDALHVYGGVGYTHDDNLFRLADEQPAFGGKRGDSARQTVIGLYFDKTYGRQKVFLQAKRSKVAFSHFEQLDYDGKDYLGTLDWQLGNHLEGKLGASYAQTLAPYTDFRSSERNLRVQKRQHGDAAWRFHPSWRVRGGFSRDKFNYELQAQRFNNRTEDALEAGFDYLPRSGSTAGLVARRVKGKYQNQRVFAGAVMNDSFEQDELKAKVLWKVTPLTSVQALAGYARRKHAAGGPGDVKGFNGRVIASLNPRTKVRVNGQLWREFAPIESNIVSFSLNRGASVGATWDATAKVRVDGALSSERRSYEGRLILNAPRELKDRIRQAQLSASWSPRPALQLSTAFSHQRRAGAEFLGNGSFKANTVSVNASAQF